MTNSDRAERVGCRLVGLQRAVMNLEWLGLLGYVVKTSDVDLQLWEIVEARVAERQA